MLVGGRLITEYVEVDEWGFFSFGAQKGSVFLSTEPQMRPRLAEADRGALLVALQCGQHRAERGQDDHAGAGGAP